MNLRYWIAEKILRVPVKSQVRIELVCEEADIEITNKKSGQHWAVTAEGGCAFQGWDLSGDTPEDHKIMDFIDKDVS